MPGTFEDFLNEQSAQTVDRSSLLRAAEVSPDEAAEAQQLAPRVGLPAPVVQRNLPDVRKQQSMRDFEQFLIDTPELASLSRDDGFLAVAQDQTQEMGGFKRTMINLRAATNRATGGLLTATGAALGAIERNISLPSWLDGGFGKDDSGQWRFLSAEEMRAQRASGESLFGAIERLGSGIQESAAREQAPLVPWQEVLRAEGVLPTTVAGAAFVAEQAALSIPEILGAFFAPYALGTSYAGRIGEERRKRRAAHEPDTSAAGDLISGGDLAVGALAAVPIALLNKYGADKVLATVAALEQTAARRIISAGVAEGVTEVLQEEIEYVAERAGIDPIDVHEMIALIPPTLIGAAGAGAALRGGTEVLAYGTQQIAKRAQDANGAMAGAESLAEITQVAQAMKLRERSPEQFQKFVDALDQTTDLYIAPQDLESALSQSEVQLPENIVQRIEEATEAATPVRFTVAEYATYFAGAGSTLNQKIRIGSASAMNAEEAANIEAEFAERAEQVIAAAQDADALVAEGEQIREQVQAQIVSTGRFRADVADAYAALVRDFFVATSGNLGVSPAELYARYPLRIQAAPLAEGEQLDQAVFHGTPHSFDRFDLSKIGTGEGNQSYGWGVYFADERKVAESYTQDAGQILNADIPDAAVAQMLDWDAPLSDQPYIMQQLGVTESVLPNRLRPDMTGQQVYTALTRGLTNLGVEASPRAASLFLASRGIPGVRYFDGASRQRGEGTRNTVVWDQALLDQISPQQALDQQARGQITFSRDITTAPSVITLLQNADLSTFLHESGHFFFEVLADLAARPDAPAQIQQDVQTLFSWVDFKGTAAEWRALPIEQRRDAHEQFARGFEAWLLEGKAPSQEQRRLFQRFRAWLLNIYKSLQALNVNLTNEVRSVMSRMVATREQVLAAEQERALEPMFPDAQSANMTPEEWQAYQNNWRTATENAQDQLQARSLRNVRWLNNARSKELKKLQADNAAKRAEIREEVADEIAQRPERIAETLLLDGEAFVVGADGEVTRVELEGRPKLSTDALVEMYGTTSDIRAQLEAAGVDPQGQRAFWHQLPRNLTAKQGVHPDVLAELVGMTSGDQLVRALLSMAPRETLIEQMTDARVLQRYGDLSNSQELERAADIAVHNQMRTRMVATELAALEASTAPGRRDALRRAAREFAERVVRRKKVRDLRPSQFSAAEAAASREAKKALASGDSRLAAVRKRDQLFNGYASRAASRAQDAVEKGLRYLNTFSNPTTRKALEPGYRDQIDKLLERFDLKARSLREIDKRTALANWIKEQQDQGNEPAIPDELLDEAQRTHYRNLTVEQFEGLVDAVKNIEHLARLKNRLLKNARQRDFDKAKAELVASIEKHAPAAKPEKLEADASLFARAGQLVTEWLTSLRKLASVVRVMDGGNDGGLGWEYLVRPLNDAADAELRMRAEATQKLNELLNMVPGLNPNVVQRVGRRITGQKKVFIPAIGKSLSLEARLAVALNAGNEGNVKRLLEGNRWTQQQLQAVIDTLTKQEMDFVQAVLDFIGSYWPEIKAKELRVSGVSPEQVPASPIQTKYGEYRGGYYPIVADPMRSDKAAQQNDAELISQSLRGAVSRATTRRGHTKERVGGKDPVRLDLGVIAQHVSQVTHDLAWHETLIDYNKLLRDREVSGLIRERYGADVTAMMRRVADDVARGEVAARTASERVLNYLRTGSTVAGLGLSATTTLLQLSGFTQSFVRVGYRAMGASIASFAAHPVETTKQVYAKSVFMRDRSIARNRELGEIFNRLDGKTRTAASIYFWPIQAFQTVVDVPTWLGAYNKALQEGEEDARAVHLADQAVRDAQSSGQLQDLAEIQRGGPLLKLFTNFYSYFSATYQLAVESAQRVGRERTVSSALRMATDYLMLVSVPIAFSMLLKEGLRGDEPEDELPAKLVKEHVNYALGMFPLVREIGGAIEGFDYRGPAGLSFFGDASQLVKQAQQGEVDEAFLRSLNRTAGILLHYPAGQVDRTVRGMVAIAEGDAGPQAILVGPPVER